MAHLPSWKTIETICDLLNCQLGDILEYVPRPLLSLRFNPAIYVSLLRWETGYHL